MLERIRRAVVRSIAFTRKEIVDVLRQPRLVLTLVVGPFLILLLFGVGYRSTAPPLVTTFVVPDEGDFAEEIEARLDELGNDIEVEEITTDREAALADLTAGRVQLVVVAPEDPITTIRSGERAIFEVLHGKLDPFEQATISLIASGTIDIVNRRILEELVAAGQDEAAVVESLIPEAQLAADALEASIASGDDAGARSARQELLVHLQALERATGPTETLVSNIEDEFVPAAEVTETSDALTELVNRVEALDIASSNGESVSAEDAAEIGEAVDVMGETLVDFRRVEPEVLVSPFGVATDVVGAVQIDLIDYYAPGVITLLLQHLAITFAGLSLVRERAFGTTELFAVAPVGVGEMLVGKYLGYTLVAAVLGAALSALMFGVFGVVAVGSLLQYALVIVLMVVAALGVGFVISSVATSDIQAVNAAMIVLLLSIFFSGFFLDVERLLGPVRLVSWVLPITHALGASRDVLFRGLDVPAQTWAALGLGAVALMAAAWMLIRPRLSRV